MAPRLRLLVALGALFSLTSCVFQERANAQTIWSGLTKTFSKAAGANETLPANQDVLTANVKLTRSLNGGGMINIASESFFTKASSPALTVWATDLNNPGETIAATNYQNLVFTGWLEAFTGEHTGGSGIEGRMAVGRLLSDNIYLDFKFTSWESGHGGAYSYMRAQPPAPQPSGDYNGNGRVDAADYVLWRRTLGQMGIPNGSGADGNSNGQIDNGDYTYWRERFGTLGSGASLGDAEVPEPATALCVVFGCGVLIATRLVRHRR